MDGKASCIKCNCKFQINFYPFLIPIIYIFIRYFKDLFFEESKPRLSFKILRYNLPYLFYLYLPKVLSIFLIQIIKFNTGENINKNIKKCILLIYLTSLLEVVCDNGDCILYYYQRIEYKEKKIWDG